MNILQFIILTLILIFVCYLVGFGLVTMIDNRLSKVSIQLPSQEHVIKLNDTEETIENFISLKTKQNKEEPKTQKKQITYNDIGLEGFDNYSPIQKEFELKKEDIRNKACMKGDLNSNQYGMTNYNHPKEMSHVDKVLFMSKYPPNMTLQDYVNWLRCFENNQNDLNYIHTKNLNRIKKGERLDYEENVIPPKYENNKEIKDDYFEKLYLANGINLSQKIVDSDNSKIQGYNYQDYF